MNFPRPGSPAPGWHRSSRLLAQFLRRRCQPTVIGVARERLAPSRRSARLVPVVLPLLHGPPHARGRPPPDQTLEGDTTARRGRSSGIANRVTWTAGVASARRCCTGPTTAAGSKLAVSGRFARPAGGMPGAFPPYKARIDRCSLPPCATSPPAGRRPPATSPVCCWPASPRMADCSCRKPGRSFAPADWRAMRGLPYPELAARVHAAVRRRRDPVRDAAALCRDAYAGFGHPAVAPLVQLETNLFAQELFHGPTLAFKDMAMQVLGPAVRPCAGAARRSA